MAHGGDPVWTSGTFKQDLLDDPNANFYRSYNFGTIFEECRMSEELASLKARVVVLNEMIAILCGQVRDLDGPTTGFIEIVQRSRVPHSTTVQDDRNLVMFDHHPLSVPHGEGLHSIVERAIPSTHFTFGPGAKWFRYAKYDPTLRDPKPAMSPAMTELATLLGV